MNCLEHSIIYYVMYISARFYYPQEKQWPKKGNSWCQITTIFVRSQNITSLDFSTPEISTPHTDLDGPKVSKKSPLPQNGLWINRKCLKLIVTITKYFWWTKWTKLKNHQKYLVIVFLIFCHLCAKKWKLLLIIQKASFSNNRYQIAIKYSCPKG